MKIRMRMFLVALGIGLAMISPFVSAEEKSKDSTFGSEFELHGVTNIVFRSYEYISKPKQFTLDDKEKIERLVALVENQKKARGVLLEFYYGVTFHKPSGELSIQISKNWFAVTTPQGNVYYRMPAEFYAEFRQLAKAQGWSMEREN